MRLLVTSLLMVVLAGCATRNEAPAARSSAPPAPSASATPSKPLPQPDVSGTEACAAVRAGIDAFNEGDFAATVAKFRLALPLARSQERKDPSPAADDLVRAVTYYAELSPAEYAESARSSPDFARNKEITLGQCVSVQNPLGGSQEPPGTAT